MINTLLTELAHSPQSIAPDKNTSTINVLLGVSILGTLLLAIQAFGLTEAQIQQLIRGPHGGNYWLLTSIGALAGHSMAALLTLVVGASLLLFLNRAGSVGVLAAPELLIRALMLLIAFGLFNALGLLSTNDVLFSFAIVGILLFPFRRLSARALLLSAIVMGLIFSGKSYWNFTDHKQKYDKYQTVVALEKKYKILEKKAQKDTKTKAKAKTPKLTDEQQEDKSAWEGMVKGRQYDKKQDEVASKAMRSDYTVTWSHILPNVQQQEASYLYRLGVWDIASLMLLGMALFRWGFFANRLTTKQQLGLAIAGLAIGQVIYWLSLPAYELQITNFTNYISKSVLPLDRVLLPIERMVSAVGWASLVMVVYRIGLIAWFWRAVGLVGQLGFTNYLLQSLLCSWFFYGYGLGYFGQFRLYQLYFVVAEIWMLQLVFSIVWLRYFRLGPFEWLWLSLTTGQWHSIRLQEPALTSTPVLS